MSFFSPETLEEQLQRTRAEILELSNNAGMHSLFSLWSVISAEQREV